MTIPFNNIPSNLRVPLFYAEVSNSMANTGQQNQRALIIGQKTSAGLATANVPLRCLGADDAITQGGAGSMLALMAQAYLANDAFGEVWYLPLDDSGSGVAATGTIAFSGTPTAAGVLSIYIAGQLVSVAVTASQTATNIATAVAAAITAVTSLPVTAAANTGTVTLTAKNKGLGGNGIDIRLNYYGTANGEKTPAGLTVTITAMASGATNPTLTTALTNLADLEFDFIASPYTDATSLSALSTFLNDVSGRWSYASQIFGGVFTAHKETAGNLQTFGTALNDQHTSVLGFNDSPTPSWVWAAAYTGAVAVSLKVDPARPLQTIPIYGVSAPPIASRFSISLRNSLLWSGISTFTVDQGGLVHVENAITTYQKNSFGTADNSYLEVETMYTLMYVIRTLRAVVTSKYARVKLAANGTRFAPGSGIVTPNIVKADLIATYQSLEYDGYVQKADEFAKNIIVQINSTNPNRLDVLWPGTLIGQLRIFALLAQFRLM